eukprot:4460959-Amphidinium_carterae.1
MRGIDLWRFRSGLCGVNCSSFSSEVMQPVRFAADDTGEAALTRGHFASSVGKEGRVSTVRKAALTIGF